MSIYRVVNSAGEVVNRIEWDGKAVVGIPPGTTLLEGPEEVVPPAPLPPVAIADPLIALSRNKQSFGGRLTEFAVFAKVGSKIAPHVHETGHYAIHVNGRIRTQAEGQEPVVLTSVGQSVYFPAGVKHWLEAEEAGSVCLQVHDVARNA